MNFSSIYNYKQLYVINWHLIILVCHVQLFYVFSEQHHLTTTNQNSLSVAFLFKFSNPSEIKNSKAFNLHKKTTLEFLVN